jgi:transposase-like protein
MRIKVQLPKVQPDQYDEPTECPYEDCNGRHFKPHGLKGQSKPLRDPQIREVIAYRHECLRCRRTFRVYPRGVSRDQQSDRLKGISVILYVLGLSYGAVEDFLEALGVLVAKTTVYENVQEAGFTSRQRQKMDVVQGGQRVVIGSDGTYVKVKGQEVGVQVVVDDRDSDLLGLEIVASENIEEVRALVGEVADQVGAEVLVSDDLNTYKNVADGLALAHQICRHHVKDNVDELTEELQGQLSEGEPMPEGVESSPEDLLADWEHLRRLVRERPADGEEQLGQMYHRYQAARQPAAGQRHDVWYRTRMLITRLWERWRRLTLDQRRDDLDGTNNSSERTIGWWIKERYRTMRGYKRRESIRNVVTLTARMGVRSGAYDMAELYA